MTAPWSDLTGDVGFDAPSHHRAQEDYGGQEWLEASSVEGLGKPATARWRAIRGGTMARARKLGGELEYGLTVHGLQ